MEGYDKLGRVAPNVGDVATSRDVDHKPVGSQVGGDGDGAIERPTASGPPWQVAVELAGQRRRSIVGGSCRTTSGNRSGRAPGQ